MQTTIKKIYTIEDIEHVDQSLLSNKDFFEKLLLKFGKHEDFCPDQILEYADKELKNNGDFIIKTFMKVIELKYTKNSLYENHQEIVSSFYYSFVKPILGNETLSIQLIEAIGKSRKLNDPDFLDSIHTDYLTMLEDLDALDESEVEDLMTFLVRNIFSDTSVSNSDYFLKAIDIFGWFVISLLPESFKNEEAIYIHAIQKNIKAKDLIPKSLLDSSDTIKSILNG